eukprot:133106-Amphidinium_carterae.4
MRESTLTPQFHLRFDLHHYLSIALIHSSALHIQIRARCSVLLRIGRMSRGTPILNSATVTEWLLPVHESVRTKQVGSGERPGEKARLAHTVRTELLCCNAPQEAL